MAENPKGKVHRADLQSKIQKYSIFHPIFPPIKVPKRSQPRLYEIDREIDCHSYRVFLQIIESRRISSRRVDFVVAINCFICLKTRLVNVFCVYRWSDDRKKISKNIHTTNFLITVSYSKEKIKRNKTQNGCRIDWGSFTPGRAWLCRFDAYGDFSWVLIGCQWLNRVWEGRRGLLVTRLSEGMR